MKKAVSGISETKNPQETDPLLRDQPWRWWRDRMPVAEHLAYFDHAAVSPMSGPGAQAVQHFAADASENGDSHWPDWASTAEKLRHQFCDLTHADPEEICLVPNTTHGINLVAEGWDWQPGDNVIVPEGEFPSNLFPWQNQAAKGVDLRVVPRRAGEVHVRDLIQRVDERTRMIAVSWVGYASGFRIDLPELVEEAHRRGVLVFLDAIQGLGVFPLDLRSTPVDFLAADGHKWLLGPEGIGVAMIRKEHLGRLRCGQVGWNSVKNAFNYAEPKLELRNAASRFEGGSLNLMGAAALHASLDIFLRIRSLHGEESIANRILSLSENLVEQLVRRGVRTRTHSEPKHRSGIVTFELPEITPASFRRLAFEQKVVVSCRDGGVRASVHAYNNEEDIERLLDVVGNPVR